MDTQKKLTELLEERFKEHREDILNARWYGAFGMYSSFLEYIKDKKYTDEHKIVVQDIMMHLKESLKYYEEAK